MSEPGPQDPYSRPAGDATPPLPGSASPEQPGGTPPTYPQAPPAQPGYAQPGYSQPGYAQPAPGQPGYQQPYAGAAAYPVDNYGYQGGGVGYAPRPNNSMALVSLISGIAGLTIIPLIGSIVAVITGIMARRQIAETGEEGGGMATAGLVMGWIGVGLAVLGVIALLLFWGFFAAAMSTTSYS